MISFLCDHSQSASFLHAIHLAINIIMRSFFNLLLLLPILIYTSCDNANTIHPIQKDITETVYASGKIVPDNEHWVSSQTTGRIARKAIEDGDTVRKGQLLYVISDEGAKEKLEAAEANLRLLSYNLSENSPVLQDQRLALHIADLKQRNDSANYVRWKSLWEREIGTMSNLENAHSKYLVSQSEKRIIEQKYNFTLNELQTSLITARSQLATARKELADDFVCSDQDGIVYSALKEEGENVSSNERLVLIGNAGDRVIRLSVDQQDISRIKIGQRILLQVDARGSEVLEATVVFISPVMNEADQAFRVDAKFNEAVDHPFIYTSVEANIIVKTKTGAMLIPRIALQGADSVWVKENGQAKKVAVKTGITTLDYVEVVGGINEKTELLLDNVDKAK
jgi:HlyD family secretion protein